MSGQMNLPKGEEHIPAPVASPLVVRPVAYVESARDEIAEGLASLAAQNQEQSRPRKKASAAQAQTYLNDQIDPQLMPAESAIRYIPNAAIPTNMQVTGYAPQNNGQAPSQYTPSPEDAVQGAYSAGQPRTNSTPYQQLPPLQPQPAQQPQPSARQQKTPQPSLSVPRKSRRIKATQQQTETVPTLVTAPSDQTTPQYTTTDVQTVAPGLTDDELIQRNLPPLRGRWIKVRPERTLDPREDAELQLAQIESGYSGWLGGSGYVSHRSGNAGYDALTALVAPFEVSGVAGGRVRFTIVAEPVFLDSGQATGNAVITVTEGGVSALIPEPLGTLQGTALTTTPPTQQNAAGVGGELQMSTSNFGLAVGATPFGFLVQNYTGRFQWRPAGGPLSFSFVRDAVKDSQLSWAGLRDPASFKPGVTDGTIWGGVISNAGNIQVAKGDLNSGYYIGLGGQYITGYNVETNNRFDGSMGAYWRVLVNPEYGSLNVGANFFGMHYAHNERAYTYGLGGYFSPEAYFLANIPITWNGHYGMKLHYNILGSLGLQAFQEDSALLFPLSTALTTSPMLPAQTSVGANYDLHGNMAYSLNEHWFVGGFLSANNSRDYNTVTAGFFVRYMFRPQHPSTLGPTGLFPVTGFRPFLVP
jgi:hypothetical protein